MGCFLLKLVHSLLTTTPEKELEKWIFVLITLAYFVSAGLNLFGGITVLFILGISRTNRTVTETEQLIGNVDIQDTAENGQTTIERPNEEFSGLNEPTSIR
ncbi:hypothetical protein L596_009793 [Steinernema carpocapsae]|uniref:Uncharacterized protein n=1 Tax=Steinernema carpocapsae TaxID=34508 RepID=A0A4U5PGW5_STECR|nr:hypothetical protein L596_009793 [Steinernema carpocapsae]